MKDVFGDILETLRVQATLYFRTDFSPPWAVEVPAFSSAARFHLVARGICHVRLPSGSVARLEAGDLAVIPRGTAHILADRPDRPAVSLDRAIEDSGFSGRGVFVYGKGDAGANAQMVCGHFDFPKGADHAILRALPDLVVLTPADRAERPFLDEILSLLERRVFTSGNDAPAAVSKLSEILLIEIIRASVSQSPELRRVIGALTDHHIGGALARIHSEYAAEWSVETLATAVGMSRSRFAERFTELVGTGPMKYLAEWRMQRAMYLLSTSRLTVQEIAAQVGYQSAAAFSRAFAQRFGGPPLEFKNAS